MVARIIEERVTDGQFDECDLTLRDLERIREAFVGQLLGMYHTRIAYPQNTVVELESRRAAGGGGSGRQRRDRLRVVTRAHLPRSVAGRPDGPRRRPRARVRARPSRGRSPRRSTWPPRAPVAGVDRADPVRRRRAGRAQRESTWARPARPTSCRSRCCRRGVPAAPGATDRRPARRPDFPLPPGRRPHLGDIVVSVERAIEQAETGPRRPDRRRRAGLRPTSCACS